MKHSTDRVPWFFLLKIGTITVYKMYLQPHPHCCELVVYVYDCMHYVLQGHYFWRNCIFKSDFQNQEFRSLTNYLCSIYVDLKTFYGILLWNFAKVLQQISGKLWKLEKPTEVLQYIRRFPNVQIDNYGPFACASWCMRIIKIVQFWDFLTSFCSSRPCRPFYK